MNRLSVKKFLIFLFVLSFAFSVCEAQSFDRPSAPKQGRGAAHKGPMRHKQVKVKEPKSVSKAKKKTEASERKHKKDYAKFVKANQKRSIEIQSPEVQDRMKQNMKDSNNRYKMKKKSVSSKSRKAGQKYR
jgi:hypothetical protein